MAIRARRVTGRVAATFLGFLMACLAPSAMAAEQGQAASVAPAAGSRTPWPDQRPVANRADPSLSSDDDLTSALLSVQEAGVLKAGLFEVAFSLDNYDRDPLGIDVVDGVVTCRLGIAGGLELRLGYEITRSVSTPGAHPVPPPPLDIVVAGGEPPSGPYRAMYWPMPFLSHKPARVDDMVPGEYSFGLKGRLFRQRGLRPALALGAQLTAPGNTATYDLSKGSGSGAVDVGLLTAASWRYRRLRLSTNLGVTLNGAVDPGDRTVVVATHTARDSSIRRPDFLNAGLGFRLRLSRGLSAIGELSGWAPFGGHTRMQNESGATDALVGLQLNVRSLTLRLGLRQHLRPQEDGLALSTGPLAGAVDLSGLSEPARVAVLTSMGAEGFRPGANSVVLGWPTDTPLPDGARRIPDRYLTTTTGNTGFVVSLSLRVGR